MRILFDGRMYRGKMHGLARLQYRVLEHIAALRQDWTFEVMTQDSVFYSELSRGWKNIIPVEVPFAPFTVQEQLMMGPFLKKSAPDLFHATSLAFSRFLPGRYVVLIPDLTPYHFPKRRLDRFYIARWLRPTLQKARRLIVFSEHTAGDVVETLRLPRENMAVVPLAADMEYFQACDGEELRKNCERLGITHSFVLCVTNCKPHKNLVTLLRAWQMLKERNPVGVLGSLQLVLVCQGNPWDACGMEPVRDVVHLNYVEEKVLLALYRSCRMLVCPSLYEGFGLPVLEGMASGAPVIAARSASLPEVAGEAALLFEPLQAGALLDHMENLATDDARCLEMQALGHQRASQFSWQKTAQAYLKIYEEALQ